MKKIYIYPQIEISDILDGNLVTATLEAGQWTKNNGEGSESKTFNYVGFEPDNDK